jgi:hypothetical protein
MSAVVAVEDTRESIVGEAASATCATAVEHAWGFKPTHIDDNVELALEAVNRELRPAAQFRRITIGIDDILVQASSCGHACPRMAPSTRYGKGSAQADASASWIEQEIWLIGVYYWVGVKIAHNSGRHRRDRRPLASRIRSCSRAAMRLRPTSPEVLARPLGNRSLAGRHDSSKMRLGLSLPAQEKWRGICSPMEGLATRNWGPAGFQRRPKYGKCYPSPEGFRRDKLLSALKRHRFRAPCLRRSLISGESKSRHRRNG